MNRVMCKPILSTSMLLTAILFISLTALPVFALEETNSQNMTGAAVKILNKYQGGWKGWSDGCVNCDKPIASDKPIVTSGAKKKKQEKRKTKPIPKSLRRGYCECSCDAKKGSEEISYKEDTTNSATINSKSMTRSNSVKNNLKQTEAKKSFNMDVKDKPIYKDKDDKDKTEKLRSQNKDNTKSRSLGEGGIDNAEGATKEKSKFSIFSIWSS